MLNGLGRFRVQGHASGTRKITTTAGVDVGNLMNNSGGATTGGYSATANNGQFMKPLLDGFVNTIDENQLRPVYRDIYWHDAIGGTAVDLMAQIPFSQFSLSGLPDQNMTDVYADSCEAMSVPTLFPELTTDYLVNGAFVSSFNYDDERKKITAIMPQDVMNCVITPVTIYGRDPIIDLRVPVQVAQLLKRAEQDRRLQYVIDTYGDDLRQMVAEKLYPLDPKYTLYVPRRTFSTTVLGNSYYRRMLPAWLLEKALMRGTIDLSYRRQKSILHLIAGDDEWEPTDQQLGQLVQLFLQADLDPTGAIIATRQSIMATEVRSGADFWKIDESYELLAGIKMRALNINESFLMGETVLTTMDTTLSVLLEQIRGYRDMVTRKVFYQKIFPLIAKENDFRITNRKYEIAGAAEDPNGPEAQNRIWRAVQAAYHEGRTYQDPETGQFARTIGGPNGRVVLASRDGDEEEINLKDYYTPRITWHKSLKPEADSAYLEILNTLSEKGFPVTMRMLATATGMNLPDIMASLEDDVKVQNKMADYKKRLPKTMQEQANEMFAGAAMAHPDLAPVLARVYAANKPAAPSKKGRMAEFDYMRESYRDPDTGKRLSPKGYTVLAERINRHGAVIAARRAARDNHAVRQGREEPTKLYYDAPRKGLPNGTRASAIFGNG